MTDKLCTLRPASSVAPPPPLIWHAGQAITAPRTAGEAIQLTRNASATPQTTADDLAREMHQASTIGQTRRFTIQPPVSSKEHGIARAFLAQKAGETHLGKDSEDDEVGKGGS